MRFFMHGLLTLVIVAAASGCKTLPPPEPYDADRIRQSGGTAYLWTAGAAKQPALALYDYAVVIAIDDRALPPEYRPDAGMQPIVAWRMEVPAGKRFVVVLAKELNPYVPFCWDCATEKATHVVEFTAEAGRAYMPLASDKCGRKWIWIADAGPSLPDGPKTQMLAFVEGLPTAGGESPRAGSCE